ncbi:MAG: hypothetical protein M1383_05200 [Patescibacteria group bacterium]|nr:hypothetical protein [Patescibacteria group bacterium]
MSRVFNNQTLEILKLAGKTPGISARELFAACGKKAGYKDFYNNLYRLIKQELLERKDNNQGICLWLTDEGNKIIGRACPERDGIWKLVIFDIPEKQKYVRVVLRAKLKALHFKKWQNSIWVSPFKLDEEIEQEMGYLAQKFFVRLIKTTDINFTKDLENLFK